MPSIDEVTRELNKPLDPRHVRPAAQFGPKGDYIEGWHAIAEANRIFGWDAWTREVVDCRCVMERERPVGQAKKPGWGVTYVVRVRINVFQVVCREGTGSGHGIDVDLGAAHESAIKEAETDAMKRALMTFGNPFGLALYDKTRANVGVYTPHDPVTGEVHGANGRPVEAGIDQRANEVPATPVNAAQAASEGLRQADLDGLSDNPRGWHEAMTKKLVDAFATCKKVETVKAQWARRADLIHALEAGYPDLHQKVLDAHTNAMRDFDPHYSHPADVWAGRNGAPF